MAHPSPHDDIVTNMQLAVVWTNPCRPSLSYRTNMTF